MSGLEGARITVGSKEFTEQLILGKMAAIVLDVAGADVVDKTNISGSVSVRRALLSGEIDVAWEYTGTAWLVYLGHSTGFSDQHKQWKVVHDADLKNGLVWLPPSPLNNSFAIATPAETSERLGVTTLSDLAKLDRSQLTFCLEPEFASREDGFEPMLEHYGMAYGRDVPRDQVELMAIGVIYEAVDNGDLCNFGVVTETDGRLEALDLRVLKDDEGYFPKYNVAMVVRREVLKEYPEIRQVIQPVSEALNTPLMRKLNARVDLEGVDPAIVARDWLVAEGFVS